MKVRAFVVSVCMIGGITLSLNAGEYSYSHFKKPRYCGTCHKEIFQEWKDSLMAKSYTHKWDEVEYFKLALPHSKKEPKVKGVKGGCIGCHSPIAFITGDIPPAPVSNNTRANEGVSCEVCHNVRGKREGPPFNFSYILKPGIVKSAPRKDAKPKAHKVEYTPFIKTPEFCGTCHDEKSPYGAWVKETYREWKNGPYSRMGVRCQDCHMHYYPGRAARGASLRNDVAHHVFQGAHFPSKLKGAIDIAIYPSTENVRKGETLKLRVVLFNGKAGHKIPTGSAEERMLWLEVWVESKDHRKWHLPVKKKGFRGEEYTIASANALAYQAIGEIMEIKNFKGLKRDGDVPEGARIFRKPFFDPKGRMTICQWYTAENELVDYRIGPRETIMEEYEWKVPDDIKDELKVKAVIYYSLLPSSVGKFFNLPEKEYTPVIVNQVEKIIKVK